MGVFWGNWGVVSIVVLVANTDAAEGSINSPQDNLNLAGDGQFCDAAAQPCPGQRLHRSKGAGVRGAGEGEFDWAGQDEELAHDHVTKDGWDGNGYITFCPCMGNFGNQIEQYLGAIALAKVVNRTLILPPFYHVYHRARQLQNVPFTDLFQLGALRQFHRVIPVHDFLTILAPEHWPAGQRRGYAYPFGGECSLTQSKYFYKDLNPPVVFDDCVPCKLRFDVNFSADERAKGAIKNLWSNSFSPQSHPVLAFNGPIGIFPMIAGNRYLQKYLRWADTAYFAVAQVYISETFGKDIWVAIHLRNGEDWVKACKTDLSTLAYMMASPQCHEKKIGAVTKDLCLPSIPHMLELTLQVFQDVKAKHLFIATDKHPHLQEFRMLLHPLGVSVHHLNPDIPQVDLMILGQADFFIGTCTSSFTSFVKRERDANGKPSIFWGQEYKGFQ
ncbi:GDP-fucose protein O-fucosyltransferase 1-like [Acanthaster planci]|uniref:GDP-fucose protein O-fucosyltransferase 1 n=1 Tax=Acanthaster planci TaxID=133434 RepID=A0A8B7XPT1_ACAPL|nr:GDP-fucose protein O-fucosyltransferase 1-like [Acanthaster planci]